ncbi:hypothetical protein [Flavobacterium sp. ZB4R12]|uniref:hypothetical protein n=1 Tax=Flavobacterium sp. ZB4R12 TaxID=3398732 RepID=UPI003AAAAE71
MLGEECTLSEVGSKKLTAVRKWLSKNGSNECLGCEPINTGLGEGKIDLLNNDLGF